MTVGMPKLKARLFPGMPGPTGPAGSDGADGADGADGIDGDQIFVQTSAPSTSNPEGSIWIDSDSADIDLYTLTGGAWVDTSTNLKGAPGGTPAGANTQVQYNDTGSFGAEAGLTYNKTTNTLGGVDQVYSPTGASAVDFSTVNPVAGGDPNFRHAINVFYHYQDPLTMDPAFATAAAYTSTFHALNGQNVFSDSTQAKNTFINNFNLMHAYAGGQRFNQVHVLNAWGIGDAATETRHLTFASGPIAGDEGVGFSLVNNMAQPQALHRATITSVPTPATIDTTTTQVITASAAEQTINVSSSTGVSAGQWVAIESEPNNIQYNSEVVQITSVPSATSIRGIFRNNHPTSVNVIWARVIVVDFAEFMGEGRTLVNLTSASTYSTGSIASVSGSEFTGSGTAWADNIVGGSFNNIGAISFDADTYTGSPYNGAGINGPLRDWYQIISVTDATHLDIWSMSVAGDQGYNGKATSGNYIIRPAARIMNRNADAQTLVLERSAHTWAVNDVVECAFCPYPDVTGYQHHMAVYTAGGVRRAFGRVANTGRMKINTCYEIAANMPSGGGADTVAWGQAIEISAPCDVALVISGSQTFGAIQLPSHNTVSSKITWQAVGIEIGWNSTNQGMFIQGTATNTTTGIVTFIDESVAASGVSEMRFGGVVRGALGLKTGTTTVGALPAAAAANQGVRRMVTDANATTFWSVAAGGGGNIINVTSDGTNWRIG